MRRLKTIIVSVLLLIIVSQDYVTALACTIFTKFDSDLVLVGNNEDWQYAYSSMYWIVQGDDDNYSRICFGISTYVQGGMNEKGLFYDGATCPKTQIPYDPSKEQLGMDAGEVVLSKCATVKEAIEFLKEHNISNALGDHLMFADLTGDAAVIEWVDNEMKVIPAEDNMLVATNFYLSNPDLGWYPCERYNLAVEALNKPQSLNPLEFSNILSLTAQDWGDGGTKYSNVYDLKALTVYLYEKADFTKVAVIDLNDALEKLAPDGKMTNNINSLPYQDTSLVLGGEVVNHRKIADNSADDSLVGLEESNEETELEENTDTGHSFIYYLVSISIIVIIVLFVIIRRTGHSHTSRC